MKVSISNQRPIDLSSISAKSVKAVDKVALVSALSDTSLTGETCVSSVAPYSAVLSQQLSHAQSSLQYSQQLFHALASYEKALTQVQSGQTKLAHANLDKAKQQVENLWNQRLYKTHKSLDYQGKFHLSGEVTRPFNIQGIDLNKIHQGAGETLLLMKQGVKPTAVVVGGGQDKQQLLHSLRITFAPSGIQIRQDQLGQLQFVTKEQNLSHLQQELLIRGGGHRIPAGQIQAVDIVPDAPLMDPSKWQVQSLPDIRAVLKHVAQAKAQIGRSYRYIHQTIEQAKVNLRDVVNVGESKWANDFVEQFHQAIHQGSLSYHTYQELYSASQGIRRNQVSAILKN